MNELVKTEIASILRGRKSLLSALDYPVWNYITQTFDYTRAYDQALLFSTNLLKELERQKEKIPPKEYNRHLCHIYGFLLKNLDKLDRWEDYLELWDKILLNIKAGTKYVKEKRHQEGIEAYIMQEEHEYIYVHFLWSQKHRKEVIERKIAKKKSGRRFSNVLHERQNDLTAEEVRERLEWIINFRTTGVYDFNPPASRQRAKRREKGKGIIDITPLA
jgi:hypothetical protein